MLGFLANLRDLKASLVSGMVLLCSVWLVAGDAIAAVSPGPTTAGRIATLVDYLGPIATLGMVSFAAYILGLVLSFDRLTLRLIASLMTTRESRHGDSFKSLRLHMFVFERVKEAVKAVGIARVFDELAVGTSRADAEKLLALRDHGNSAAPIGDKIVSEMVGIADLILEGMKSERFRLATQMGHTSEQAFNRYDKARSEAEFRAALVVPLFVLGLVLAVQFGAETGSNLVAVSVVGASILSVCVLAAKAYAKFREADGEIVEALILKKIDVRQLQVLEVLRQSPRDPQPPEVKVAASSR